MPKNNVSISTKIDKMAADCIAGRNPVQPDHHKSPSPSVYIAGARAYDERTMTLPLLAQTLIVPEALAQPAMARWMVIMVAVGLAVLIGVASFKSSKRSHRD